MSANAKVDRAVEQFRQFGAAARGLIAVLAEQQGVRSEGEMYRVYALLDGDSAATNGKRKAR
jgi:hypothetical protein